MIDSIKITSLTNIGANLSYTSIFPVVNITGTPITNKANLQIIGNYILSQAGGANMVQAAQATLAQAVVNAAQPNITSVGTLSISTLKISGGVSGYILRTDGAGNLTWISPTSTVSGSDTQVQFNNAGSFGSSANFTYDNGNNILNVIRANASYLTAYESVSTANLAANGLATIARINVTNTANLGPVGNITITGGSNGQVLTTNGNGVLSWTNDANSSYGDSNVVSLLSAFGSNTINTTGNVTANYFNGVATDVLVEAVNNNYSYHMAFVTGSGDTTLHMDNDDNLQYNPAYGLMTVIRTDMQYLSVANSVLTSLMPFDSLPLDLGSATNPWQDLYLSNSTIYLGDATISANGNSIVVDSITVGGNVGTIGNIANINLTGSNTNVLYGNGVFAAVAGGNANTGNVTFSDQIILGTGSNDGGGGLYLAPGNASIANSAVQYLRVRGGDAPTHIHLDTGNNAYYDQYFGADSRFVKLEANGNVVINADDYAANYGTWTFGTDGNLTLPLSSVVYETNIPDGALSGSAIALKPTGGTNADQQLLIYPTAADGDHIHLTSGNLYQTELFLGSDNLYVKLANTGNVIINSNDGNSNSAMWTFDTAGNLMAPGVVDATGFVGDGSTLSNVATKVTSSWTLASGNNTVSISVPSSGTYSIWINGNIPNGIVTYLATAVVTNTNVPVLGDQYGWYYADGNALVLTSIPNQFVGTAGAISNVNTYLGNTANVFTFGITNNSGNAAVINYGYTKL